MTETEFEALYETVEATAQAMRLTIAGRHADAQQSLWEATAAAAGAFPFCSFEAICLDEVLGAVADAAAEEAAA